MYIKFQTACLQVAPMLRLTVIHTKGQGAVGQGERVDQHCKWMAEEKEDGEGEPAKRSPKMLSSSQTPADSQLYHTLWSQALRTLRPWRGWCSFAPVGVVWLLCQAEALLHPYVLVDQCWRFLLCLLLWMALGACVYALKYCLRQDPDQFKVEPLQKIQQDVVSENRNGQYPWVPLSRSPGLHLSLALALANSLLLCVLQEPLPDPSVPHIQSLLSRLESVSHTLQKTDHGSEVTLEEEEQDSMLTDKVKLICTYLQQRMRLLHALVQVQGDFEARVKDILGGLDGLWAQLEELHTGVTLTKEESQGHGDLALAHTDAENLFSVLGHYRNRLQCCQTCLKDSTQLLQELTWSHTHMSHSVSSSCESVWPELLLQSNIEQFDKVQESFCSLEQQTSTFKAHLQGLTEENLERRGSLPAHVNGSSSCSVSPHTSPHLQSRSTSALSLENCNSTSASTSASSVDEDAETDATLSLCERSALQLSSTLGRLRKSGRRK